MGNMVQEKSYMEELGKRAKKAALTMSRLNTNDKNEGLMAVANALIQNWQKILEANETDVNAAALNGMKSSLIDRLKLTKKTHRGYG